MSIENPTDDARPAERLLDCGRDPVDVVDRARAGRSSTHEKACPYCQAAIAADAVTGSAAQEFTAAELEHPVPATLLPNVMRSVWSDLRRSTMIPLGGGTEVGSAFVADHTIAAVIELALEELTQLQIHTCSARLVTVEPERDPAGGAGSAAPATVAIEVTAAAAYNADVRAVATRARDIARSTVAEQFGWTAEPIDIEIVDVYVSGGDVT